jgi:hypothetical protein
MKYYNWPELVCTVRIYDVIQLARAGMHRISTKLNVKEQLARAGIHRILLLSRQEPSKCLSCILYLTNTACLSFYAQSRYITMSY